MSARNLTRLYDQLTAKLGKETAEDLNDYIDTKIPEVVENKCLTLATKEDISRMEISTKDQISRLEMATRDYISKLELSTKDHISRLEVSTNDRISRMEISTMDAISKLEIATRKEIARLEIFTKNEISRLDNKIGVTKNDLMKWMFVFWTTQMSACITLIYLYLRK